MTRQPTATFPLIRHEDLLQGDLAFSASEQTSCTRSTNPTPTSTASPSQVRRMLLRGLPRHLPYDVKRLSNHSNPSSASLNALSLRICMSEPSELLGRPHGALDDLCEEGGEDSTACGR